MARGSRLSATWLLLDLAGTVAVRLRATADLDARRADLTRSRAGGRGARTTDRSERWCRCEFGARAVLGQGCRTRGRRDGGSADEEGDRAAVMRPGGSYPVQVNPTRAAVLRLVALLVAVALAGALAWLLLGGDIDAVRETVEAAGPWAPLVYVALHVLLTLVPVPKNLLRGHRGGAVRARRRNGPVVGGFGARGCVGFAVARRLGREAVA